MNIHNMISRYRRWDSSVSKWLMNNFYYTFFHLVIVTTFFLWAFNMTAIVVTNLQMKTQSPVEKLMLLQSYNAGIMTFLLFLISLWILYLLNNSHRIKNSLKNISYNTATKPPYRDNRRRPDNRSNRPNSEPPKK